MKLGVARTLFLIACSVMSLVLLPGALRILLEGGGAGAPGGERFSSFVARVAGAGELALHGAPSTSAVPIAPKAPAAPHATPLRLADAVRRGEAARERP